jgi:dihydroorotase
MLIENARWVDARGQIQAGTIRIEGDRIRLGASATPAAPHERVLDGTGAWVLPGLVDAHTHLREPGQAYKEGITNGSRAALKGGVTTLLDMPNNVPPITSPARLAAKRALFQRNCRTHWGVHVQAPVEEPQALGPHAAAKLYMAKSSELPAVRDLDSITRILSQHRRVAVHAEDESCFLPRASFPGGRSHHLERPVAAVRAALETLETALERLPESRRPRLVLCHATTAAEVAWLKRMKASGFDVWGETCPHYLLFTDEDYVREGQCLKVNPPLRSRSDREAIRQAIAEGVLDFVSSDHAPHAPREKADEANAPSGIPGIEWMAPALLHLVDTGILDWPRFIQVSSTNACRCYDLRSWGGIADGALADLILVSRNTDTAPPVTLAGHAPYAALGFAWRVDTTLLRGSVAFEGGRFDDETHGEEVTA